MENRHENEMKDMIARFTDKISGNFLFKESGKIIGISTFSFALAAFYLKSLWYFYQWGKFNALKVSTLYIDMGNGNHALYSAIAFCAVVFAFLLSNVVVYNLTHKKRYGAVAGVILVEYCIFIIMIKIESGVRTKDLVYEITQQNGLIGFLKILLFIFIIIIAFNLWGAVGLVPIKLQSNIEMGEPRASFVKVIKDIFIMFLIVVSIQLLVFYYTGYYDAVNEKHYKVILKYETESELIGINEKYIFSDDSTDSLMVLQAVLIETQNEYITCYCYEKDEQIYANLNIQQVIPKENIITRNVYNIEKVSQ